MWRHNSATRTLIDGSCLLDTRPTGVSITIRRLLEEGRFPLPQEAEIVTYGLRAPTDEQRNTIPLPWKHYRIPSKLMHALCGSGLTSLDQCFGAKRLFLPNLNIIGIPKVPYELFIHDISFLIHPWWFSLKTRIWHRLARPRALICGAERLYAVSEWTKRDLIESLAIPEERIEIIDITPKNTPTTTEARPLSEPYFLLFAAGDTRKNARCAVLAFCEFAKTHPEWKLVLVNDTKQQIDHPQIIRLPYLPTDERYRWLQHASALLYPSWYEGFGLPPHEAQNLGVPVLASGIGPITERAPAGTRFLPPHTPQAWWSAMEDTSVIASHTKQSNTSE